MQVYRGTGDRVDVLTFLSIVDADTNGVFNGQPLLGLCVQGVRDVVGAVGLEVGGEARVEEDLSWDVERVGVDVYVGQVVRVLVFFVAFVCRDDGGGYERWRGFVGVACGGGGCF
jgi:hypothetical protein